MPRQVSEARKPARKAPRPAAREARKASAPVGIRTAPKGHRFHAPEHAIREHALGLPQAYEDFPWGHRAFRVNKKVFLFLAWDNGVFTFTAKLPHSQVLALSLPFAEPTGYGMGKSGWVTARFSGRAAVPVGVLFRWIDESYRAVAPKKVAALLGEQGLAYLRWDRLPGEMLDTSAAAFGAAVYAVFTVVDLARSRPR